MTDHETARCESGTCLQVETRGESTVLWESTQPDIRVVTTTASWQSWLDQAADGRQAAIVAWLLAEAWSFGDYDSGLVERIVDLIDCGDFDDLAAGDE